MDQSISKQQIALNKALHATSKEFGNKADGAGMAGNLPRALLRMHELGICDSVLDYGTGKGKLVTRLREELPKKIRIDGYDPAIDEWDQKPNASFHIVTCLDVLEHIELTSIDAVLTEIKNYTQQFCYLVIDLQPAVKTLADGRNAHILLAPPEWWVSRIAQYFSCIASFPIKHVKGFPQKLVICATDKQRVLPFMYGFITKMNLNFAMSGGPSGGNK